MITLKQFIPELCMFSINKIGVIKVEFFKCDILNAILLILCTVYVNYVYKLKISLLLLLYL